LTCLPGTGSLDRSLITYANGSQFGFALEAPQRWVMWVVIDSNVDNGVSQIWGVPRIPARTDAGICLAQDFWLDADVREARSYRGRVVMSEQPGADALWAGEDVASSAGAGTR